MVALGARIQVTVGGVVLRVVEECRLPDINLVVRALRDKGSLAGHTAEVQTCRVAVEEQVPWETGHLRAVRLEALASNHQSLALRRITRVAVAV